MPSTRRASQKREEHKAEPPNSGGLLMHGAADLPLVHVDSYNEEIRDREGFLGDRASNRAFHEILDEWRAKLRRVDEDPLGKDEGIRKKTLDKIIAEGDAKEAGLVQSVIEEFAQEFSAVVRQFLKLKAWSDTDCIVVGGGLRKARVGEIAIGRAAVLLKTEGCDVDLKPIRHHPDEAGLLGCAGLAPSWVLKGHDAILAVDIGGSNIRAGLVDLRLEKAPDMTKNRMTELDCWCYSEEKQKPKRDEAVEHLAKMLRKLIQRAHRDKLKLAPFVGLGCPGIVRPDGSIDRGAQNLPGNWESKNFNLPKQLHELIPTIDDYEAVFIMHNDAVVQGLSEAPFMGNVDRWGVLTIGTGLGNARFTAAKVAKKKK